MNQLKIFNNEEFGKIRTVTIDNKPWFVGKDVATALGYERADNAIRNHVEEDDKLMHQISASGQNRQMYIINESGLYALIFGSKLESAKELQLEEKVKELLNSNELTYESYESFLDSENMYLKAYEIEI